MFTLGIELTVATRSSLPAILPVGSSASCKYGTIPGPRQNQIASRRISDATRVKA